jgi:hypothetical protein
MMNGPEKSDPAIVAGKPTNKAERSAAELVEPRAGTKGNADQLSTRRTQRRISVTQGVGSHTAAYAVNTRGGSRMRESRLYGSVRGARGNSRPYREWYCFLQCICRFLAHCVGGQCPELTSAFCTTAEAHGCVASAAFVDLDSNRDSQDGPSLVAVNEAVPP